MLQLTKMCVGSGVYEDNKNVNNKEKGFVVGGYTFKRSRKRRKQKMR